MDSPVHIGKRIYWARHDRTNRGNKLRTLLPGRTLPLRTYTDQCTLTLAVITAAITLPPSSSLLILLLPSTRTCTLASSVAAAALAHLLFGRYTIIYCTVMLPLCGIN